MKLQGTATARIRSEMERSQTLN